MEKAMESGKAIRVWEPLIQGAADRHLHPCAGCHRPRSPDPGDVIRAMISGKKRVPADTEIVDKR